MLALSLCDVPLYNLKFSLKCPDTVQRSGRSSRIDCSSDQFRLMRGRWQGAVLVIAYSKETAYLFATKSNAAWFLHRFSVEECLDTWCCWHLQYQLNATLLLLLLAIFPAPVSHQHDVVPRARARNNCRDGGGGGDFTVSIPHRNLSLPGGSCCDHTAPSALAGQRQKQRCCRRSSRHH